MFKSKPCIHVLRVAMLSLIAFNLLLFNSCKKDDSISTDKLSTLATIDKSMLVEILYLPSQSAKRIAFGALNADEKTALWKLQLEYILKEIPLDVPQSNFIKDLMTNISSDLYSSNSTVWKAYRPKIGAYEAKAKNLFSWEFIVKYFTEIVTPISAPPKTLNVPKKGGFAVMNEMADCGCSTTSDWCWWSTKCKTLTYPEQCKQVAGCGFMTSSLCNGKCVVSTGIEE